MKRLMILAACVVPLAGCAGQAEMRELAGNTAGVMNDYRRELGAFADRQSAANADNQARVANMHATRAMSEAYVRQRLLAIKVAGDKNALETYDLLASATADQLIAASPLLNDPAAAPAAPVVKLDASGVEKLTRQLNALRKPPTYWDRVRQVVAYGEGLRSAYATSLEEARSAADAADAQAEQVGATVSVPAPPPPANGPEER